MLLAETHRDSPTSSRGFCGLSVGLGECQELEGLGKKEGALLCCPCHASLAASSRVCSLPTRQTEISPSSWLSSATAASAGGAEQWGTSCRAQIGAVPSCTALAAALECCRAERFWGVQPLRVGVGSNLAAADPIPVPWCCLSLFPPWLCRGQARVVPAQPVPGWQERGVQGGAAGCGGGAGPWVLVIGSMRARELRGSPRVGPEPVLRQEG